MRSCNAAEPAAAATVGNEDAATSLRRCRCHSTIHHDVQDQTFLLIHHDVLNQQAPQLVHVPKLRPEQRTEVPELAAAAAVGAHDAATC